MPYSIHSVVLAENTLRSTPAQIHALSVPHVGNRTHLVHDGTSALVIDAPRDLALVERTADALGVPIVAVADTHVHNDYVSGAAALAERHGADYLLSARERVDVHRLPVHGGDLLWLGGLQIEVLDSPGHTAHHQSFLVRHGAQRALFSGGSLLHGTVGRTDLVDPALTVALAGEQWDSARRQGALPRDTGLFPTHGFGSFCAGGCVAEGPRGLIAHEHGDDHSPANESLVRPREEFVRTLVAGYGPIPAYYRHMAPLNRAGAGRHAAAAPRAVAEGCVLDAARELGDIGVEVAATHVLGPAETWLDRADYRVVDWERFAASDPSDGWRWTCATTASSPRATSRGRSTCRCPRSRARSTACRRARSGCTATAASAPRSPPACSRGPVAAWCSSPTTGIGSATPASRWSAWPPEPPDAGSSARRGDADDRVHRHRGLSPRRTRASAAQPPATAGMTETWTPSGVSVPRLSRKRTSSLPT